jgi:Sulfotransferase domain
MLEPRDVPIASYPGSGSSLISNILVELGFTHIDPYAEEIAPDGATSVVDEWAAYHSRLRAVATPAPVRNHSARFFKNHLYPREYEGVTVAGAVLLVRDPRDAVHSSYQWFRGFSAAWLPEEPKGQGTFAEFLDGLGINSEPPISHWVEFNQSWLEALPGFARSAVVRFEDLKSDPVDTATGMLDAFGLAVDRDDLERAVESSSFSVMRAHEDEAAAPVDSLLTGASAAAAPPRINRRGKVDEWREWIDDPNLAKRFSEPSLVDTAARFGYRLDPPVLVALS